MEDHRFSIVNIDTIIVLEKPKLGDYKLLIQESLSEILQISKDKISVKAKTKEELESIGKGEAVEASAVVLIQKRR